MSQIEWAAMRTDLTLAGFEATRERLPLPGETCLRCTTALRTVGFANPSCARRMFHLCDHCLWFSEIPAQKTYRGSRPGNGVLALVEHVQPDGTAATWLERTLGPGPNVLDWGPMATQRTMLFLAGYLLRDAIGAAELDQFPHAPGVFVWFSVQHWDDDWWVSTEALRAWFANAKRAAADSGSGIAKAIARESGR